MQRHTAAALTCAGEGFFKQAIKKYFTETQVMKQWRKKGQTTLRLGS